MFHTRIRKLVLALSIIVALCVLGLGSLVVAPNRAAHAISICQIDPTHCITPIRGGSTPTPTPPPPTPTPTPVPCTTFHLASQASASIVGGDADTTSGTATFGELIVSKYTNGCGDEYGEAYASAAPLDGGEIVSFSLTVNIESVTSASTNSDYSTVTTPTVAGDLMVCATADIQQDNPAGGGGGSACTPN